MVKESESFFLSGLLLSVPYFVSLTFGTTKKKNAGVICSPPGVDGCDALEPAWLSN